MGWKDDFPIEWERDHYVSRRELTKFLVLGSGTIFLAHAVLAVWARLRARRPRRVAPARRVARAADVAPGASLLFRYPTDADP